MNGNGGHGFILAWKDLILYENGFSGSLSVHDNFSNHKSCRVRRAHQMTE
ncbi:hypothetical protein [Alysiella crassa]|nr:hypothetical protein [Alysiella crassa]UOP06679.1 hypothetical protein LVJ80_13265 [Alysiella crassa]